MPTLNQDSSDKNLATQLETIAGDFLSTDKPKPVGKTLAATPIGSEVSQRVFGDDPHHKANTELNEPFRPPGSTSKPGPSKRSKVGKKPSSPLRETAAKHEHSTLQMVADAVQHNQTLLAYQPVTQAMAPRGIAFYEGFIRVLDPAGRVIPARDFMHVVEEKEIGREIDCHALQHGLQALKKFPQVRLSLNMSARSIGYHRWEQLLDRSLKQDPTLGERLVLEINEASAMAAPELVSDFLGRMQKHGIAFALDNFGASTTVIGHFRQLLFDAAKIDGQFVRGIHANRDNQAVVRALIGIAKQFDMFTVAEMVESREDAEFLVSNGVDCLQGYLFGGPSEALPWTEDMKQGKKVN
ncbi:EAL domain protein [Roseobacter sp. SK209-2-6]|nr:EAL domain protein [Roseobacter sp. SK209-2-6]